jgi:DNA polymerase-3 subunit delta'
MNTPHIEGHHRQKSKLETFVKSGSIPHAILFTGPSGIGKRLIAHAFLAALFCSGENKPCGKCPSCIQIAAGSFPDLFTVTPNDNGIIPVGSSDKPEVNSARWIVQRLGLKSVSGRTAALIDGIDRTHGDETQNALLKTLEEPGEGTCLVLIASERAKVLPTIISRCIEIRFAPLSEKEIRSIIADLTDSGDLLDFATVSCGGSVEKAKALLNDDFREDIIDACREISRSIVSGSALKADASVISKPKNNADGIEILISIYHHMLRCRAKGAAAESSLYDDISIDDIPTLCTIIKMLLAIKKGRANNLNAALQLKALAYHANDADLPEPPFAPQL